MIKSIIILLNFLVLINLSYAQVAINEDDSNGNPSAALDIKSTIKGALFPVMTNAQRAALKSPAAGLVVFNSTSGTFNLYDAANWIEISSVVEVAVAVNPGTPGTDVGVGVGISDPDNSAMLHVNSTAKGFLLPRIPTAPSVAPVAGLMYFKTTATSNPLFIYNGSDWEQITSITLGASAGGSETPDGFLIGTGVIEASAEMEVSSSTGGLLIPRMTDAERDAIESPAQGLAIYNTTTNTVQYYYSNSWYKWSSIVNNYGQVIGNPGANCLDILDNNPDATSNGTYFIDPDGAGPNVPFQCYCDMTTDGGGWTFLGHVNSNYVGSSFFTADVGTYLTTLADDGTTYGIGGKGLLPNTTHTEMMVWLDNSTAATALAASKVVFFQHTAGHDGFDTGPIACSALGTGFSYRVNALSGAYTAGGTTNSCNATTWYTRTVGNAAYLTLFNSTGAYGNYWGAGMGGNNSWNHDGWWFFR